MRWRKRYGRIVKRFALFPIKAKYNEKEEWRWLEIVYLQQTRDYWLGVIPFWSTVWFVRRGDYNAYMSMIEKEQKDG